METIWVDKDEVGGPYTGMLFVMSPPEDLSRVPSEQRDALFEAVSGAHASGLAVIYLYADAETMSKPSDELDRIDGMDHARVAFMYGRDNLDFSSDPATRNAELVHLFEQATHDEKLSFEKDDFRAVGWCRIGGQDAFMPLTSV